MTELLLFYRFLILMLVPFVFGCATTHMPAQSMDLPNWVFSPLQDSVNTHYGLGQRSTMANTTQAASADVAAKL